MNALQTAFEKYETDKEPSRHNYGEFYYPYLEKFRENEGVLLEIGIQSGASLMAWRDFLPRFKIIGIDVELSYYRYFTDENLIVLRADQNNPEALRGIVNKYGAPTIVVDDGSHDPNHQIRTYEILLPLVTPGGIYIIEDLQTSYPQYPHRNPGDPSCVDYLTKEVHKVMGLGFGGYADPRNETPENKAQMGDLAFQVRGIHFHRFCCLVEKW